MSSIIFLETADLQNVDRFYTERLGLTLWLDQGGCRIYRDGYMLLGFCEKKEPRPFHGILTWFYAERDQVDRMAASLKEHVTTPPGENKQYRIYQCFAEDPEGRVLEFQHFLHPIDWEFPSSPALNAGD